VPRSIPEDRFEQLVHEATEVFIARGYRHTQMADVATAVGVSKGTLYLYVESKDALFALCLMHAARRDALGTPPSLPVAAPAPGELRELVEQALSREVRLPTLERALERPRAEDVRSELDAVFRELYDLMERGCCGIKLLDRCWDHPEIGPIWQTLGRELPRRRLADYVASRVEAGQLPDHPDASLVARLALETCVTWAVHIKWDRAPEAFDPVAAREIVLDFVIAGLLGDRTLRA
jgi:AcrR family transcriptional regulator